MLLQLTLFLAVQSDFENLQHKEPAVRARAAEILGLKKEPKAIPFLIEGLQDKDLDVRAACHKALAAITGQNMHRDDVNGWKEWWTKEGQAQFPSVEGDPKRLAKSVEDLEKLKQDILDDLRNQTTAFNIKLREDQKRAEEKINTSIYIVLAVAVFFMLVMIYFVGHVSSRIKEWKELMRQADVYIKEGRQITDRVDAILDEVEKKKNDLLDFYGKLKDDSEDEISRFSDLLQQKNEHRLREEVMELRQKAEKELEATMGDLKKGLEHENRKLAEAHRSKIDKESAEVHSKFIREVEAHRLFMEGTFYFSNHRHDDAVKTFRRLLEIKPDHILGWLRLGDVLREQMKFDDAVNCYRKALDLSPSDSKVCYSMAALHARLKQRDKMLEFLRRAIANDGEFKDEALNDPAFRDYWHDPEFKDIAEG